jgi:hypothetical protein
LDRGVPSAEGLATILDHYYHNREDLQKVAGWCHDKLQSDEYKWENIGKLVNGIIERTLNSGKKEGGKGFGN